MPILLQTLSINLPNNFFHFHNLNNPFLLPSFLDDGFEPFSGLSVNRRFAALPAHRRRNFAYNNHNNLGMSAYIPQMDTTIATPVENEGNWLNFPLNYGDEWDLVSTFVHGGERTIDSIHYVVDGWGALIDVSGEYECLRMRKYQHSTKHDGEIEIKWDYSWITPNYGTMMYASSEDNEQNPDFTFGNLIRTLSTDPAGVGQDFRSNIPAIAKLKASYPNPFNLQTNIGFSVANSGNVELSLFDASGRLIAELIDGSFTAGNYNISFSADGLNQSVYFVKLTAG